jgi:hypothetical protein
MDHETMFEKWRRDRAAVEPAADFTDRVMQGLDAPQVEPVIGSAVQPRGLRRLVQATACAAAVLAALFRVVELLSLFATSQIEI